MLKLCSSSQFLLEFLNLRWLFAFTFRTSFSISFLSTSTKLKLFFRICFEMANDNNLCILKLPANLDLSYNLHTVHHLNTLKYQDFVLYWKRSYLRLPQFQNQFNKFLVLLQMNLVFARNSFRLERLYIFPKEFFVDYRLFVQIFISFFSFSRKSDIKISLFGATLSIFLTPSL